MPKILRTHHQVRQVCCGINPARYVAKESQSIRGSIFSDLDIDRCIAQEQRVENKKGGMMLTSWFSRASVPSSLTATQAEHALLGVLVPVLPDILKGFYAWIQSTSELSAIVLKSANGRSMEQMINHLTKAQIHHWSKRLEEGDNTAYRERIQVIGNTHMRIGLPLQFFVQGYRYILIEGNKILQPLLHKIRSVLPYWKHSIGW